MKDFNATAAEIGALVTAKNEAYGNSFAKCGEFLRLLYPEGIQPPQYDDALAMVRIFDKQMRIATRKDAFGESPYRDIAGYGILGAVKDTPPHDGEGSDLYLYGNLCPSCQRTKPCTGQYPATADGGCEGYIKAEGKELLCDYCQTHLEDQGCQLPNVPLDAKCADFTQGKTPLPKAERKPSLCHSCHVETCSKEYVTACEVYGTCDRYQPALRERMLDAEEETIATAKQDAPKTDEPALDFTLPPIILKCTAEEAQRKFVSEVSEWRAAEKGSLHEMVERWDCLQALNTYFQRNGDAEWYQAHVRGVMDDLARWHAEGRDVMEAKAATLRKNAAREYYSKGVNDAINLSGGFSFTPKEADA